MIYFPINMWPSDIRIQPENVMPNWPGWDTCSIELNAPRAAAGISFLFPRKVDQLWCAGPSLFFM